MTNRAFPKKIVCLTEESVETLYLLGKEELISGVSVFVKRPEAAQKLPKISHFTSAQVEKIVDLKPDLVLGFSDIQKDIARDLIGAGLNVFIANHRSIEGIIDYVGMLSRLVGAQKQGEDLQAKLERKIDELQKRAAKNPLRVYFEEWDEPKISAIRWVSELIGICGGKDINLKSNGILAKDRFMTDEEVIKGNPEIIIGCWCGKKVKIDSFKKRANWDQISAVKSNFIYEVEPEIFLQPGPAPILDGGDILLNLFGKVDR